MPFACAGARALAYATAIDDPFYGQAVKQYVENAHQNDSATRLQELGSRAVRKPSQLSVVSVDEIPTRLSLSSFDVVKLEPASA